MLASSLCLRRGLGVAALALPLLLLPSDVRAQTLETDFQLWDQVYLEGRVPRVIGGRLRLSMDAHVRRMNSPVPYTSALPHEIDHANPNPQRPNTVLILRPALGLAFGRWASVWLGYAWQPIFFDAADLRETNNVDEHRIWYQLAGTWTWRRLAFSFRSRLEHRFRSDGPGAEDNVHGQPAHGPNNLGAADTAWAHRFRQQVRLAYTLRAGMPWLLVFWDEILFHLNETNYRTEPGLDQNRAFLGVGYAFGGSARMELGYLNQYVHRYAAPGAFDPNQVNHVFSVSFTFRFGFDG